MASLGGETARGNVDLLSVAVAIAPEKGRAPVKDKVGLADLSERMKKLGGKSVFEADVAQNEEDLMVNFDEMRRVLDAEKKKLGSESDEGKKADLTKRYDRLVRRFNVYDKLLNNEGFDAMTADEKKETVSVVGRLPGFCEAAVLATGGRVTVEQMQKALDGKGGALTAEEQVIVGEMVSRMVDDPKFHNRLSKNLAGLKMDEKDAENTQKLEEAKLKTKDRESQIRKLSELKTKRDTYDKTPDEQEDLQRKEDSIRRTLKGITDDQYMPSELKSSEINTKIDQLKAEITKAGARIASAPAATAGMPSPAQKDIDLKAQLERFQSCLETSLTSVAGVETELTDFVNHKKLLSTIKNVEDGLSQSAKDVAEVAQLEGERSKYADKYKRKMELALSEEMKRYWNEVVLTNASTAAEAQAQKKAEAEKKAADHKEKQTKLAKDVLDKYLQLSFIKYKGGEAVGWDDKALKQFVKKDMLSKTPEQLTKDLFNRINMNKMSMPKDYGIEMKRIFKEMGVGTGDPPLTVKGVMEQVDREQWGKWAEEKIPDILGYAWARGYYFDRLKLKPAQAEFLQRAYKEDFFGNALAAKGNYATEAETLMAGEFMDGGAITKEKIKEMLGKDWVGGSKKLMKLLAYAGAGYVLGGGLAWGTDAAGLALGARQVGANLRGVGILANQAAIGVSRLGNAAGHAIVGNATIAEMDNAAIAAANLDTTKTGWQQAGGLIQKISETGIAQAAKLGPKP